MSVSTRADPTLTFPFQQTAFSVPSLRPPFPDGAASSWHLRTFSEGSIQSADYQSAEEDELSDVVEEEFGLGDEEFAADAERCARFFTLSGLGSYVSSFFWGAQGGERGGRSTAPAGPRKANPSTWVPKFRSLSRASRQLDKHKAEGGRSLRKAAVPHESCKETGVEPEKHCWDEPRGHFFPLRGKNYLRDRIKLKNENLRPVYELVSVDFYSSERRMSHVARRLKLPSTDGIPEDCPVTPLLVVNYQAPMYPAKIFGKPFDGESLQVVAVYKLRDGFVADEEVAKGNLHPHTLKLLKEFCEDATDEATGVPSRDRLKMIPAMPNLEEWISKKTFGRAEAAILTKWQNKPMLVRPQVEYHVGPEYIEIDINIHDYIYATRRYFHALKHCLKHGVMDMALVLEGRRPDQLPEQVLASIRLQQVDFGVKFPPVPPLPNPDSMPSL